MCAADSFELYFFSVLANLQACFVKQAGTTGMGALING